MFRNHRKYKPYAYGSNTRGPAPSLKEMGSGAANPGSTPITTPGTPMALKSDLSDVNGTSYQIPAGDMKLKYKYKYKYPMDKYKRKASPLELQDDVHMQAKALPGEQYRGGAAMRQPPYKKVKFDEMASKTPGIEPRSVAGDQYEEGASVNTEAVKQRSRDDVVYENQQANFDFAKTLSKAKLVIKAATPLRGYLPPNANAAIDALESAINSMNDAEGYASILAPIIYEVEKVVEGFSSDSLQALKEKGQEAWDDFISKFYNFEKDVNAKLVKEGKSIINPKGVGKKPGESSIPSTNVISSGAGISAGEMDTEGQGEEPMQAYGGEEQKAMGGDPNRLDPITPATGSRQTAATANSLISIKQLKAAAERTARELGPAAVHGNARERANMGKGALDTYEFQGPYDYPVYPGGRPDDTLTMMGAWRTNGGNDSSLWYSKKTAKGANARRNKYFKWSTKGGGRWRKLSKDQMVNVIQKGGQSDNRFYGTRTNLKFAEFQRKRDNSVRLAREGNRLMVNSNHGYGSHGRDKYVDANIVGVASKSDVPENEPVGEIKQESTEGSGEKTVGEKSGEISQEEFDELNSKDYDYEPSGGAYDLFRSDLKAALGLSYLGWSEPNVQEYYTGFMNAKRKGEVGTVAEYLEKRKALRK